jgi:hypothetical protein
VYNLDKPKGMFFSTEVHLRPGHLGKAAGSPHP